MDEERTPLCDLCINIMTGECTLEERLAFERHLPECPACQAEMKELMETWGALYADMEWMNPPEDLKQQVLNAAFAADKPEMEEAPSAKPNALEARPAAGQIRWYSAKKSRFMTIAASVLFVLFLASSALNIQLYRNRNETPATLAQEALNVSASQIKMAVPLRAQSAEYADAYGFACIVDNGKNKQFVVYVYGAPQTAADEAYQVWLIKDGVRTSAGTFRVTKDNADPGLGVLTLPMRTDKLNFDTIGITLEPDDKGNQPRGKKMFSSI